MNRERQLDKQLQAYAVDGRVHVMHRPMQQQGDDAQLDTTFAYIVEEVIIDGKPELMVSWAVAHKNPKDNFCRRIGRLIAKGRLAHPQYFASTFSIQQMPETAEQWRQLDDRVVYHYIAES